MGWYSDSFHAICLGDLTISQHNREQWHDHRRLWPRGGREATWWLWCPPMSSVFVAAPIGRAGLFLGGESRLVTSGKPEATRLTKPEMQSQGGRGLDPPTSCWTLGPQPQSHGHVQVQMGRDGKLPDTMRNEKLLL